MTAQPSTTTLARKVSGLVRRYIALSAERRTQATGHKAEASYLYGAAAAFEVVATELWEALGKHGPVPQVARALHLSVLADRPADGPFTDGLRAEEPGGAAVGEPLHGDATT